MPFGPDRRRKALIQTAPSARKHGRYGIVAAWSGERSMKIKALAIAVAAVLAAAPAGAQQTAARIDCAASQLLMPPNFICLASNEVADDLPGGPGGGLFKYWNAIGKLGSRKAYV